LSEAQANTIRLRATLNGQPWSGSITLDYIYPGASGSATVTVCPTCDVTGVVAGEYRLNYKSDGPPRGTCLRISPSPRQTLTEGGTVTFTFEFTTSPPAHGIVQLRGRVNGQSWAGPITVDYDAPTGSGVATITLGDQSDVFAVPGTYRGAYQSGGPAPYVGPPVMSQTLQSGSTVTFLFEFSYGPTLSSLSPARVANGTTVLRFALSGSRIQRGATVLVSHPLGTFLRELTATEPDWAVTVVSSTELQLAPPPATVKLEGGNIGPTTPVDADPGPYGFRIKNPDGQRSNELTLEILPSLVGNNARFVSQSGIPTTMIAGESYVVWITMQNTGAAEWPGLSNYKLGSQTPQDNTTWGFSRVQIAGQDFLGPTTPGSSAAFGFTVTAPTTPGTYDFQWRMVQEHVHWFGDVTPLVRVNVQPPPPAPASARVTVNLSQARQTIQGIGGQNFKWGADEVLFGKLVGGPMSAVHQFTLNALKPSPIYVVVPMILWEPDNDNGDPQQFNWAAFGVGNEAGFDAIFRQMQDYQSRGLRITATMTPSPAWLKTMLPNPDQWIPEFVESIAAFLVRAKQTYGVTVDRFAIGEPENNPWLTPAVIVRVVKEAGARFAALGLPTRLDASNASAPSAISYATATLQDSQARSYVGDLAYHSWGAENGPNTLLQDIAGLAQQYNLPVTVPEFGEDPGTFSYAPPVFSGWSHAWRMAKMYSRVLRYSRASVTDAGGFDQYYPMVDPVTLTPYPLYYVTKQLIDHLPAGTQVVEASADAAVVWPLAAKHVGKDHFMIQVLNTAFTPIETTLEGLPNTSLTLERTRQGENLVSAGSYTPVGGRLALTLPSQSISLLSGRLTVQPATDTTPPTVSITAPATGATVSGTVTVTASASDNIGVTKVEFSVDGILKSTDAASPYTYVWNTATVANGSHALLAKASDAAGNVGQSSAVSVSVSNTTLIGDLNGDGRRTLTDVRWLIEMLVGLRAKNLTTADLTGDGQLTLADVQALIRLLVGPP